jgi:GT2 family glycosyltransferase
MPELSIIIVNWNTQEYLDRCLACVYQAEDGIDMDVWVVDNASSDGSVLMVKEKYHEVNLIQNRENAGFSRANNQAIQQSAGDLVLLLNSDAFVERDCLRSLMAVMQNDKKTGVVGGRLLNQDGSLQRSCFSFPTLATELWQTLWLDRLFPASKVFGKYLMTYWSMDDFREVDVVMGAVMLLRRQALNQVGLLDERFFMYSEEVDLCYRMIKNGWKVQYVPEASSVHIWGGSSQKVKAATLLRLYQSRVQFFRKHYGTGSAVLFKGIILFNGLSRSIFGGAGYLLTRHVPILEKSSAYWQLFRAAISF